MALDFSGTGQYLTRSLTALSPPLTLAGWFNPDATNSRNIVAVGVAGTYHRHDITLVGGAVRAISTDGTNAPSALTAATVATGAWQHACGIFTSNTSRAVYLNGGGKVTNAGISNTAAATTARVGCVVFLNSFGELMDGRIAEAGIWNVALTDDEVAALARGYSPRLIRPQSLVLYAPLVRDVMDYKAGVAFTTGGSPTVAPHPPIIH